MREPAAKLSAEGLRILIIAAAVIGGGRLVPAEANAPAPAPVVDLQPIRNDLADLRREFLAEMRDIDRRLVAVERRP